MFLKRSKKANDKIRRGIFSFCVVVLFVMCPIKTQAAGATICHKHIAGCYENQPVRCADDIVITTHNEEFNCETCGRVAAARVVVETYSCKYMQFDREFRRMAYCYSCGGIVQNVTTSASEFHVRTENVATCGMNESTILAKVTLTNTTTKWTNDQVVLKADVEEPTAGQSLAPYSYTFSGGVGTGNTCTVNNNGTYSVTITATNGQQATASIRVDNIDKEKPGISNFYVDKEYPEYESANLVVDASDSQSGLADKAYSFNGGISYGTSNKFQITTNGTYTVYVRDKVGNTSTQTLTVKCFEKKPEVKPSTTPTTIPTTPTITPDVNNGASPNQKNEQNISNTTNTQEKKQTESEYNNTSRNQLINSREEQDVERELLKKKLENSDKKVALEDIPGVYSSVLKTNAEKNAVPMTLNVVSKYNENIYSDRGESSENLVKNITLNDKNSKEDGRFAQVTKAVVGAGVLLCIGMVGFLIVFLVKKH